jgi:hypothetical protein
VGEQISGDDLHVLRHMLGIDDERVIRDPYRNHYCANEGDERLHSLAARGLVTLVRGPTPMMPYETFAATDEGRRIALESQKQRALPKRKRVYSRFLDVRDCCPDLTFREFLTSPDYAECRRSA